MVNNLPDDEGTRLFGQWGAGRRVWVDRLGQDNGGAIDPTVRKGCLIG